MERLNLIIVIILLLFLIIRYNQIKEYGVNRELYSNLADSSLIIDNIDNFNIIWTPEEVQKNRLSVGLLPWFQERFWCQRRRHGTAPQTRGRL